MKTICVSYITILVYYLLGTIGIYIINRKKEPQVRRRAWIKHISYFIITTILFFSIAVIPVIFHIIAILIIIVGFYELYKLFRESGFNHKIYFWVAVCIFTLFSAGFYFFSLKEKELILFSFIILCIFDGFSQVSGQLFGRTKLFPKISPHKTVEGLIGGTLIAVLSTFLFKNLIAAPVMKSVWLAIVVVIFAFIGDSSKSLYKRKYNVKDFSNLIPGHGGFLDRFDSLIAGGAGVGMASLFMNF